MNDVNDFLNTADSKNSRINTDLSNFNLAELLNTGCSVILQINSKHHELDIPKYLKKVNKINLKLGFNLYPDVQDLVLEYSGIFCELFFNGNPYTCFIPWESITGYGGDAVNKISQNKRSKINDKSSNTKRDSTGKVIRPKWLSIIK